MFLTRRLCELCLEYLKANQSFLKIKNIKIIDKTATLEKIMAYEFHKNEFIQLMFYFPLALQ